MTRSAHHLISPESLRSQNGRLDTTAVVLSTWSRSRCAGKGWVWYRPMSRRIMCKSLRSRSTFSTLRETNVVATQSVETFVSDESLWRIRFNTRTLSCGFNAPKSLKTLNGRLGGYLKSSAPKLNRHCWKLIKDAAGKKPLLKQQKNKKSASRHRSSWWLTSCQQKHLWEQRSPQLRPSWRLFP